MTNKKANEHFRTKYPNGHIALPSKCDAPAGKYFVTFEPLGKVYYYSAANYDNLLGKLGIRGFEECV